MTSHSVIMVVNVGHMSTFVGEISPNYTISPYTKMAFVVQARVIGKHMDPDGMGLGYTWWSGGSGLKTSLSTNYDMLTNTAGTDTDGNLSLVVGFGF